MDRDEVASKTKEIIADKLTIDLGTVSETSKIVDDLGADSLDAVEIMMAVEEQFSILLEDKEAENIKTVGQAIDLIFKKRTR